MGIISWGRDKKNSLSHTAKDLLGYDRVKNETVGQFKSFQQVLESNKTSRSGYGKFQSFREMQSYMEKTNRPIDFSEQYRKFRSMFWVFFSGALLCFICVLYNIMVFKTPFDLIISLVPLSSLIFLFGVLALRMGLAAAQIRTKSLFGVKEYLSMGKGMFPF